MIRSVRRRRLLSFSCAIAASSPTVTVRAADASEPVRLREERPFLERYREDNARLIKARTPVDCVFMGDSITERWSTTRHAFFSPNQVGRGISGQTTPEMLLRFRADVVGLRPKVVHIVAGTNDIAGNTGPETPSEIIDNIRSMTEIALANGIRVVLASVPPAARYPWRPSVQPVQLTRELNRMLAAYASDVGAVYVDYYSALADRHGGMLPGLAVGEVHPTDKGYAVMEPEALHAVATAMQSPQQSLCRL
jgi:lysophospholipase L1-like esterase